METWITLNVLTEVGTYELELSFHEAVRMQGAIAAHLVASLAPEPLRAA